MKVLKDVSLLPFNTFKINVHTKKLIVIENEDELRDIKVDLNNYIVLGGGSNVLFTKDFDGIILKNEIKGKQIVEENDEFVILNIKSAENWHNIVMWAVENNWNGIENLALIPGTAGAAPMQNIGAYGVEIKDVIENVRFFNFETKEFEILNADKCEFGYRDSIFKKSLKNKVFITDITLRLRKKNPVYRIDYGNIKEEISKRNVQALNAKVIADIVIDIRKSKLPDPAEIGNAGSFFKNPEVDTDVYLSIKEKYPDVVAFKLENNKYKLAAGWLIEQCGMKGYDYKGAAVHTKQALVLINKNNATGKDILELSEIVQQKVFSKFGVKLEREVNVY